MSNYQHRNYRPLEWSELVIFTSDKDVKGKRPACRVSHAEGGNGQDLFSYTLGWERDGEFRPLSHLPDDHVAAFLEQLQVAASEAKVAYLNARKLHQGTLAASMREQLVQPR